MIKIGRQKKPTQYLSVCLFRQMANVGGKGLLNITGDDGNCGRSWFIATDQPGRESQYPNRDCQRGARSLSSLLGLGKWLGLGLMVWL